MVLVVDTWLVKYKQNMSFRLFLPHAILFIALLSFGGVITYLLSFMDYFTAEAKLSFISETLAFNVFMA